MATDAPIGCGIHRHNLNPTICTAPGCKSPTKKGNEVCGFHRVNCQICKRKVCPSRIIDIWGGECDQCVPKCGACGCMMWDHVCACQIRRGRPDPLMALLTLASS